MRGRFAGHPCWGRWTRICDDLAMRVCEQAVQAPAFRNRDDRVGGAPDDPHGELQGVQPSVEELLAAQGVGDVERVHPPRRPRCRPSRPRSGISPSASWARLRRTFAIGGSAALMMPRRRRPPLPRTAWRCRGVEPVQVVDALRPIAAPAAARKPRVRLLTATVQRERTGAQRGAGSAHPRDSRSPTDPAAEASSSNQRRLGAPRAEDLPRRRAGSSRAVPGQRPGIAGTGPGHAAAGPARRAAVAS